MRAPENPTTIDTAVTTKVVRPAEFERVIVDFGVAPEMSADAGLAPEPVDAKGDDTDQAGAHRQRKQGARVVITRV